MDEDIKEKLNVSFLSVLNRRDVGEIDPCSLQVTKMSYCQVEMPRGIN